jgi:hypothetical protein
MAAFRHLPDEVFTPRSPDVNPDMYVQRPDLELALRRALAGTKNIIISGESGNGKTWLYKRVFGSNDVHYDLINLANASLKGGLQDAFKDKVDRLEEETKIERTKSGGIQVQPGGMGVKKDGSITFAVGQKSAFENLLSLVRARAGKKEAVLVYDNFEQVAENPGIIKAISDTIILLDDDDLARYKVKLCVVGVPTDIKDYLSKSSRNITTLANRLTEIPEVARMSKEEASKLAASGFNKLGYKIDVLNVTEFYDAIGWKTDRIAQHIHEYCLAIAHEAERNYFIVDQVIVAKAEKEWLKQTLTADYSAIEERMNARDTKAGRRNQVLYSLGKCDAEDFRYGDIEKIVRAEFSKNTTDVGLNIAGNLTELAAEPKPLIRRTPKGDAYRFTSPKYRMCLRTMLRKNSDERVEKIPINRK